MLLEARCAEGAGDRHSGEHRRQLPKLVADKNSHTKDESSQPRRSGVHSPSIQRPTPVVARAALVRGALLGRAQLDKFVRWLRHLTSSGFVRWLRHRGDTAAIRSEAIMTTVGLKISLFHFMYVLKYLLVGTGIEL